MNSTAKKKSVKKPAPKSAVVVVSAPEVAVPAVETPPVVVLTAQQSAVAFLQKACMEVSIEVSWFATSKQIEGVLAARMLNSVNASKQAVTLSKRLFDSKHPAVKAANASKTAITAYRDSMTIPAAAVPPEGAADPKMFLMKEPGTRLILTEMIDEFTAKMDFLISNLMLAVSKLDENLTEIKHADSVRLGDLYNAEDYPESIAELISVRGPFYKEVSYTANFEKLAPEACKRAMNQLYQKLSGTIDLAASDVAQNLLTVVSQVANQLSNRTRIYPGAKHPTLGKYHDAEVTQYCNHDSHPDELKQNEVLLEVRYKPVGELRNVTEWLPLMSEAEYQAMAPSSTTERKKVHETSVENLQSKLESFKAIGHMLGDAGKPIAEAVSSLSTLLAKGGKDSQSLLVEMRDSKTFRSQLGAEMSKVSQALSSHIGILAVGKPKRRAIGSLKSNLTNKAEDAGQETED